MPGGFVPEGPAVVRITPADVGKRVSVRRVAEIADGRPVFSDAVGTLTSWSGGVLVVTRRNGEAVHVPESALVAGKTVPPPPPRRRAKGAAQHAAAAHADIGIRRLDGIAARGWPALENEPLGEWTLRASGGFTRRANSVLPHGSPGLPLDRAMAAVTAWYADRGLPARIQIASGEGGPDDELDRFLAEHGWTAEGHATVRTAPLHPLTERPGKQKVRLTREPGDGWTARYQRTGRLSSDAYRVLVGGPSVWFATVPADEPGSPPLAIGRCVVDGRWAGFAAVEVAPERRRRGLATAVMAALAARAAEEGAECAYLQVEASNDAAEALYNTLGFTVHHAYHYRRAPSGNKGQAAGAG